MILKEKICNKIKHVSELKKFLPTNRNQIKSKSDQIIPNRRINQIKPNQNQ